MRASKLFFIGIVLTMAACLCLGGCTLIGMKIGSAVDKGSDKTKIVRGWNIVRIPLGKEITVTRENGENVFGRYQKVVPMSNKKYRQFFLDFRAENDVLQGLPAPEERAEITLKGGDVRTGIVKSYHRDHLELDTGSSGFARTYYYTQIAKIGRENGQTLDGDRLRSLKDAGRIPANLSIVLDAWGEEREIPISRIREVAYKNNINAKEVGFVLGLAVDTAILIAAATYDPEPTNANPFGDEGFSCPFIYSFDGRSYTLDSETFGGAIFKAAQRADFDNLDHLQAVAGKYKLRLTNELPETQYVDALALLVVDHPHGVRVIPDFEGKLHTFSQPLPPIRAIDKHGNNILPVIAARDKDFWISYPFGCSPEIPGDGRDWIELTFDRPAGADSVKLAMNLRNTQWASYLQGRILSLQGDALPQWYEMLNTNPMARATLKQVMIREGMLLVKIRDGEKWRQKDFIWEVGPALPKDQAVKLSLAGVPGDRLRIRLESTVGLWMINHIAADFSPDAEIQVNEISLNAATGHDGADLLPLLREIDGEYYVMPSNDFRAELVYTAPPLRRGFSRSVILKSSGYYKIHIDAHGEPQRELMARLILQPGAYGAYTLRLLRGQMAPVFAGMQTH